MEALKTALISQLVLIPWLSSLGDGYLTFWDKRSLSQVWWVAFSSHSASNEGSSARPQLEVRLPVASEARAWSLEQGSLLRLSNGLKETKTWLIGFLPLLS